jgi:hypothetical protein
MLFFGGAVVSYVLPFHQGSGVSPNQLHQEEDFCLEEVVYKKVRISPLKNPRTFQLNTSKNPKHYQNSFGSNSIPPESLLCSLTDLLQHLLSTMKVTALLYTILTAATVGAAASVPVLETRDTCGPGYAGDQRRTGSPCQASNGDRRFCGCDRTGVVC